MQGRPSISPEADEAALGPLQRYRQSWQDGTDPELSAFVDTIGVPLSQPLLVELVKLDLEWRWRTGRGRRIEAYIETWPELSQSSVVTSELLKIECIARSAYHNPPSRGELTERYPEICETLDYDDLLQQAKELSLRESYDGAGRFFLVRRVGTGGMGEVYAAFDRERQSLVAVKMLPTGDPELLYRFKREFRALSEMAHPHLIQLYELVSSGDKWFFTMELIEGLDLLSYIRRSIPSPDAETRLFGACEEAGSGSEDDVGPQRLSDHPVDVDLVQDVLRQLVEGLMALHEAGILHRDVKPSNILVRPGGQVVILDFGLIAEMGRDDSLEPNGRSERGSSSASPHSPYATDWKVVGTAAYMSPEQAAGQPLTTATDWYAVGVVLYRVLTGQFPFSGPNSRAITDKQLKDPPSPFSICADVPPHLGRLCESLLRRNPAQRPSGLEILATLNDEELSRTLPSSGTLGAAAAAFRDAPFVGRQAPLRILREAFEEMRLGATVVVNVSGPSGIGKTRLVRHFLRGTSREHNAVVLTGRCYERESVPYKALDQLIDSLCRFLAALPRSEMEGLLPRDIGALARLFPVLRRIGPSPLAPEGGLQTQNAQDMRQQATRTFCELLGRIGQRHPLVLWIDDLQWDDADSAVVLSAVLRQAWAGRLLLIVSYRSEQAHRTASLAAIEETLAQRSGRDMDCLRRSIELGPLRRAESEELAGHLLGTLPAGAAGMAQIVARQSRGTPYFIHELAHFLRSREDLSFCSESLRELDLQDVLRTRIERLPKEERRLLESISVAGRPLQLGTAYTAAGLDPAKQEAVVNLRSAHLLRTTGPRIDDDVDVFHDHLRTCVLSLLADQPLREHHARLAEALEENRDDPEMIATHYHRAGQIGKAISYYTLAADRAARALAFERAARLYQASIELSKEHAPAPRQLLRKLADALANAGQGRRAADAFLDVAADAAPAEALELRRWAAYHYCASGHIARGRAEFAAILAEIGMRLPQSPRAAILSCLWHRWLLRLHGLRFRIRREEELSPDELAALDITWSVSVGLTMIDTIHASDYQARNLLLALGAGEPHRLVRALAWQACHIATGGLAARRQVQRLLDAAESIVSAVDNPGLLTVARGITAFFQGEWARALTQCDAGDAILHRQCKGVVWERATAHSFALWSLYFLGNTAELMQRQPELLREARQRGDLLADASLTNMSGTLMWLARNQPQEARDGLATAMRPWEGLGFRTQHFTSLASHVQIDLYLGDALSASRRLESEWPLLRRSMLLYIEAIRIYMLHLRGCCALAAAGATPDRRESLRRARRCADRLAREKAAWGVALGQLIRAGIAEMHGEQQKASSLLGVAASHLEQAQMGLYAAAARYRQGELLGGERGRALISGAESWMAEQKVCDGAAMVNVFVPQFR